MELYINTTSQTEIVIALFKSGKKMVTKKIKAPRKQAEKLLGGIEKLLKSRKVNLGQLEKIIVANYGGSFTALRIGVITANALAYALKIPVTSDPASKKGVKKFSNYSLVEPIYDREPNIGISKKPKL